MATKKKREIKRRNTWKKIWRNRFYALIIAIAIVSIWRGVWGLMDQYLFPNNLEMSLWASVFLGVGILIGTHHLVGAFM